MASVLEGSRTSASHDNAVEREALAWLDDPFGHFDWSTTRIHSLPREEVEAVQLAAMNIRLEQRRPQIKVLEKLADSQDITGFATLDDMAPLLFPHDVYKSYPVSLLAKQKFDQLTKWMSRLTHYDLSGVDVSQCDSIDSWLVKLMQETPLDVGTSSGSSGTCSFFPKSKRDYETTIKLMRVQIPQSFGTPPTHADLHDKIHAVLPLYRDGHSSMGGYSRYILHGFCKGDESYLHNAFNYKISSDLMWLAARLRAAAAKGDVSKVDVPPSLLARRAEWEAEQANMPAQQLEFVQRMTCELAGKRVLAMGTSNMFYTVAKRGLEQGITGTFAPNSVVMGGGGAKGVPLPDDCDEVICKFFGIDRMTSSYGMTELNTHAVRCEHGKYHMAPFTTVFLLDLDTGRPLPRRGRQQGRAAFFDMTLDGTWGGIITGDLISIDWDAQCACGRTSVAIDNDIRRVSELREGGEDKISCAATPGAQAEAMDFLTTL